MSDEEIKEAILSAVKEKVYNMTERDIERIYSNTCYKAVTEYSNEIIKEKGIEFSVESKVKEIIDNLSSFTVFYRGDSYNRNSDAYELTQRIVLEEQNMLREVIKNKLNDAYLKHDAENDIAQIMSEAVFEMFSIKNLASAENTN